MGFGRPHTTMNVNNFCKIPKIENYFLKLFESRIIMEQSFSMYKKFFFHNILLYNDPCGYDLNCINSQEV